MLAEGDRSLCSLYNKKTGAWLLKSPVSEIIRKVNTTKCLQMGWEKNKCKDFGATEFPFLQVVSQKSSSDCQSMYQTETRLSGMLPVPLK